jgi:hypothetical protein
MRLPPPHAAFSRVSTTGPGTFLTLSMRNEWQGVSLVSIRAPITPWPR